MSKKSLNNGFKLGSELAVVFLVIGTVAYGKYNEETTATAEKYEIAPINLTLEIPSLDASSYPTFTPRFRVWTPEVGGATQDITSTNSKKPDIFEANQAGVAYDHGLWVTATHQTMNYGQNKADITNDDNDNESYGIAIIDWTGELTYINYGNVSATGKDSVGMMVMSYDSKKIFTNYGTITGSDYAVNVWGSADLSANVAFINYGTLNGDVGLFPQMGGGVYVDNYRGGVINGNIRIIPGDTKSSLSRVTNKTGAIINGNIIISGNLILSDASSDIFPGEGSITMNNNGGTINGDVWLDAGTVGYMTTGLLYLNNDNNGVINGNIVGIGASDEVVIPEGLKVNGIKIINEATVNGTIIAIRPEVVATNDRWGNYYVGMVAGTVESGRGDFGMVASRGGTVTNNSYVVNEGDYGMLALYEGSNAINNGGVGNGTDDTLGNYGMVALYGGTATNAMVVGNTADYGMVASGVGETGIVSTVINTGDITNDGNYGMGAVDGGYAYNEGTVGNFKDGGMVASGANSVATNNGVIENLKNDGMVATQGASVYNKGTIQNYGDVGMYVDNDSYGYNSGTINNSGNTGVFANGFFLNTGTIDPQNTKGEVPTYAVVSGNGHGRVIFLNPNDSGNVHNPIPNSSAVLLNTDGMDVLQFGSEKEGAEAVLNSDSFYYNYLLGSGWLRSDMSVGIKNIKSTDVSYTANENTWTLNGNHIFLGGVSLADQHSELAKVIQSNRENVLDTNLVMGTGSSITFVMGRNEYNNLTSPMVLANSYDITNGTHTNIVLDETFITNENRVVFNVGKVNVNVGEWNIPEGETVLYTEADGEGNNILTKTASSGVGWTPHHEMDSDGNLYLVYTRDYIPSSDSTESSDSNSGSESDSNSGDIVIPDSEEKIPYTPANPAPGGYGEAQSYPHTNLDIINTRNIINRGYLMAKRMMFARPKVVEEPIRTEGIYGDYLFAELFGDWGDYTGAGARFSYQTSGVTVGNFHRFESNPDWMVGVTYGYAHSKANFKSYKGSNEKVNTLGLNAYLTWSKNSWIVTGTVGYSWSGHNLTRKFADYDSPLILGYEGVESIARQANKKFDSHEISIGFETGYNYRLNPSFTIYPYIGFDYIFSTRDGYTENADGMAGIHAITGDLYTSKYTLQVDRNEYNTGIAKAGLITEWLYKKWCFALDLAYRYYTSDYNCITGTYVDAMDRGEKVSFHSSKLDMGRSVGYVTVGVNYKITESWIIGTEFTGYYRDKQAGNLMGANLTYRF